MDLPLDDEQKKTYKEKFNNLPMWQRAVCEALAKRRRFLKSQFAGSIGVIQPKGISLEDAEQERGVQKLGPARTWKEVNGTLMASGHQFFVAVLISYNCECKCGGVPNKPSCYTQFKVDESAATPNTWVEDAVAGGYEQFLSAVYTGNDAFDRPRCYRAFVDSIGDFRSPEKIGANPIGPAERRIKGKASVFRTDPSCEDSAEAEWVVKSDVDAEGNPTGSAKMVTPITKHTVFK